MKYIELIGTLEARLKHHVINSSKKKKISITQSYITQL